jgi:hypothetical protein
VVSGRSQLRARVCSSAEPCFRLRLRDGTRRRFRDGHVDELGIEVSAVRELGDRTLASDI